MNKACQPATGTSYTHVSSALAADGAERIGRALFGTK
jgi:hypothetical protein